MLKRYKISELFLGRSEHIEEIEDRVWRDQIQKAAEGHKGKIIKDYMKQQRTGD
ncbi:MAG: hypothetical protein AABY92_09110 [Thermodesulfobacteriota bacterium]